MFQQRRRAEGNVLFISRFNIIEHCRGTGCGKRLFVQMLDFCNRYPGIVAVEARILANNTTTLSMIKRFGFKQIRTTKNGTYVHMRAPIVDFKAAVQRIA